jgi:hypothetical protein
LQRYIQNSIKVHEAPFETDAQLAQPNAALLLKSLQLTVFTTQRLRGENALEGELRLRRGSQWVSHMESLML